jgi:hypothetical protein
MKRFAQQINSLHVNKHVEPQDSSHPKKDDVPVIALINIDDADKTIFGVLRGCDITNIYLYSTTPRCMFESDLLSESYYFHEKFLSDLKIKGFYIQKPSLPVNIRVDLYSFLWMNAEKLEMIDSLRSRAAAHALQPPLQHQSLTKEDQFLRTWLKKFAKLCKTSNDQLIPKKWLQLQFPFHDIYQLEDPKKPLTGTALRSLITLIIYLQDVSLNENVLILVDKNQEFLRLAKRMWQEAHDKKESQEIEKKETVSKTLLGTTLIPIFLEDKEAIANQELEEEIVSKRTSEKIGSAAEETYIIRLRDVGNGSSKFRDHIEEQKKAWKNINILSNYILAKFQNYQHLSSSSQINSSSQKPAAQLVSTLEMTHSPAIAKIISTIRWAGKSHSYAETQDEIIKLGKKYYASDHFQSQQEKNFFKIFATSSKQEITDAIVKLKY